MRERSPSYARRVLVTQLVYVKQETDTFRDVSYAENERDSPRAWGTESRVVGAFLGAAGGPGRPQTFSGSVGEYCNEHVTAENTTTRKPCRWILNHYYLLVFLFYFYGFLFVKGLFSF